MSKRYQGKAWEEARVRALRSLEEITDGEDAEVTRGALADPDNPLVSSGRIAKMRPASEVYPDIVARYRGQRGPQKSKPVKEQISLRVDPEVLEYFRGLGPGWMARMNDALRKAAGLGKKRA
jgi:uncharacterized protein (DUF4415 family)